MIETIRPTMSMVRDLLPGMKESWIFNDCAIGETKSGDFVALIVGKGTEVDEYFYGFIPKLRPKYGYFTTREELDTESEDFGNCPDAFNREISWANIREGHRYA